MKGKILIIDDEEQLRCLICRVIALEGYSVAEASNIKSALKILEREITDVILCDVKLGDGNGVEFTKSIKEKYPLTEIILLTAYGNIPDGIQAMKNGAFDYIIKGDDNAKIIPLLEKAFEKVSLQKRVVSLENQVIKKYNFHNIIGTSASIKKSIELAGKVAPTNTTILLLGETGTGKEVFAQAIHNASSRSGKSFLALNCSAFSKELLENEMFGHKAGAFTGGSNDKNGLIEEANEGTLFLDEIGEMPLDLQSKFLRVLESSEFIKLGDTKVTTVNVRIIAATNRDLREEVKNNKFREDLYYRLNVFAITLAPLRERKEDILLLAEYYIVHFSSKINKKLKGLTSEAATLLKKYNWNGNVRELKNVIERAAILENGELITKESLPFEMQTFEKSDDNSTSLSQVEKFHIHKVLQQTNGNKAETARLLDIGISTLYRKLDEYNIK